jgi:hypothetical protein
MKNQFSSEINALIDLVALLQCEVQALSDELVAHGIFSSADQFENRVQSIILEQVEMRRKATVSTFQEVAMSSIPHPTALRSGNGR